MTTRRWRLPGPARVALGAAVVAAAALLLRAHAPHLGAVPRPAGWPVAVAVVAVAASYLFGAVALRAAVGVPLPFGRTLLVQLAAALANRVTPAGLGAAGVTLRYLTLAGLSPAAAGVPMVAIGMASAAATVLLAAVFLPMAGPSGFAFPVHPGAEGLAAVVAAALAIAVGMAVVLTRRDVMGAVRRQLATVRDAGAALARSPGRLATVFASSLAAKAAQVLALVAALAAFDGDLRTPVVVVVYLLGSAMGAAVPTPNGLGAVEAALVGGLVAAGGATGVVVAGVLVFRLASFWLPIGPGLAATWALRRSGAL